MRGIKSLFQPKRPSAAVSYQDVWGSDSTLPFGHNDDAIAALALPMVQACVRLRATTLAQVPFKAYQNTKGRLELMSEQPRLLADPSVTVTPSAWKRQLSTSADLWGYALGIVTSRQGAFVTGLEWVSPENLKHDPFEVGKVAQWYRGGAPLDPANVVVIPSALVLPGSPIGRAALDGTGLTELANMARKLARDTFESGTPRMTITADRPLTIEQAVQIRDSASKNWRANRPAVLGAGLTVAPLNLKGEESRILETLHHVRVEICLAFGIPPTNFGLSAGPNASLTYANREQNIQQLMFESMNSGIVDIEEIFSRLLPTDQSVKATTAGIERSDLAARTTSTVARVAGGILTPNEARAIDDLPPLPGGDELRSPTSPTNGGPQ